MTDNNAQARAQLLVLKGVISELPDDEQAKVKATAQRIRAILEEDRKANGMAEASRSSTGCNRAERRLKAEAPMPESVEKAIENITQKAFAACGTTQDARPFKKDRETIRAHIAAQQAEVERLRFAATNLLDNLHGLTKLQEVQHRAPTWMKAIENSADRLIAALNPEQKGGV